MLPQGKNIFWLASYPKSGNTWFRVFLNYLLTDSDDDLNINNINSSIISSNRLIFDKFLGENAANLTQKEIDILKPEVYKKISAESNKPVYIKTHDAWYVNDQGDPIIPAEVTNRVIYFIRNPLDVAISFSFHGNIPMSRSIDHMNRADFGLCINRTKLHNQIQQRLFDWSYHVNSWTRLSKLPVHIIRYEDMINNTYDVFSRSLKFLNIDYKEDKFIAALSSCSFKNLQMQELKHGFNEKNIRSERFFRKGEINNWKAHLNKKQVLEIINSHHDIMREYGYYEEIE